MNMYTVRNWNENAWDKKGHTDRSMKQMMSGKTLRKFRISSIYYNHFYEKTKNN